MSVGGPLLTIVASLPPIAAPHTVTRQPHELLSSASLAALMHAAAVEEQQAAAPAGAAAAPSPTPVPPTPAPPAPTPPVATPAQADAARTAAPLPHDSDVPNPDAAQQLVPAPAAAPAPVDHEALKPKPFDPLDDDLLPGRRRPGGRRPGLPDPIVQVNPGAVAPPEIADYRDASAVTIPDRWRLLSALCPDRSFRAVQAVCRSSRDPYHQNTLKGDIPLCHATEEENERRRKANIPRCITPGFLHGDDWFLSLSAVSDFLIEPRSFPQPVGTQSTTLPGSNDVFGRATSLVVAQTTILSASLVKGSTAFMPPHVEYKISLAYQNNYAKVSEGRLLNIRPTAGRTRRDAFLGVQEFFIDYHLRDVSERYDFDSLRVGIQPINVDFRGFLFTDSQLGIRLFGNRDNNRWQYNLAAFVRIEKDTNSGLNDITLPLRKSYVFLANVYRQDMPVPGFTSEASVVYERNREGEEIVVDHNGFPVRPALIGNLQGRDYDVAYLGYAGEGHINRLNLSVTAYLALGRDRDNIFTGKPANIRAFFLAAEPSYDVNWLRFRLSGIYASADNNPYDNTETGFDAILENPLIAGADTSYWIRQSIPFIGGARAVSINGRNGVLADLRSSKDEGQSNFINPGTILAGGGVDADLTPGLRVSANANHLWFANTKVLRVLRSEGTIPNAIGYDISTAVTWRPLTTQNIVLRLSAATLLPGKGFRDLFTQSTARDGHFYSILGNAILTF